jgi:ribose 5-phosphate isomerase A
MHHGEKKRLAAQAALQCIKPGTILGVGTGSTVNYFIDELPAYRDQIDKLIVSSKATETRLRELDFEITDLSEAGSIDLYVDGADEANKHFHLIKGGGGALTREKILASAAREFVCIIDDSKWVGVLGKFPLPVEVIPMARSFVSRQFIKNRGQPVYRNGFVTDNGNEIIDIYNLTLTNPVETELRFSQIPGVVTVGIFAHRTADRIFMASDDGEVKEMVRR